MKENLKTGVLSLMLLGLRKLWHWILKKDSVLPLQHAIFL